MAKKPFKETKLGKFITGEGAGNLLNSIGSIATGNFIGAFDSIKDLITGSSELTAERKEIALQLLQQDLESYKLEVDDRKDARNREIMINQSPESSWLSKNTGSMIAILFTLFTCILFILVLTGNIKPSENITFTIITSVTNILMLIIGYFFGSTRSSQAKDMTIARLTK